MIDGTKDPAKPNEVPPPLVQTDGINFEGAWCADDMIDINALTTNDVSSILNRYGVEAARATVMREVSSVFGAYGIAVDPRHLGLIADFMTHQVTILGHASAILREPKWCRGEWELVAGRISCVQQSGH